MTYIEKARMAIRKVLSQYLVNESEMTKEYDVLMEIMNMLDEKERTNAE